MNETLLKICVGGLTGIGLGLIIGKYKVDQLEAERDMLELRNKCLLADCEIMQIVNDDLKETIELFANLLLRENKNEET